MENNRIGVSVMETGLLNKENITLDKIGFSVEEISSQTSLSKAYLRQKIREERLKATYFGRRVVILRDDLIAFLKNGVNEEVKK
jgi:excisionase family DNA binding protein